MSFYNLISKNLLAKIVFPDFFGPTIIENLYLFSSNLIAKEFSLDIKIFLSSVFKLRNVCTRKNLIKIGTVFH